MKNFQLFQHGHQKQVFLSNARVVIDSLDWKIKEQTDEAIYCKVGMSWESFGENIEISSLQEGTANITIKTVNPLQIVDSGKGQQLIKTFIESYQKQFIS